MCSYLIEERMSSHIKNVHFDFPVTDLNPKSNQRQTTKYRYLITLAINLLCLLWSLIGLLQNTFTYLYIQYTTEVSSPLCNVNNMSNNSKLYHLTVNALLLR